MAGRALGRGKLLEKLRKREEEQQRVGVTGDQPQAPATPAASTSGVPSATPSEVRVQPRGRGRLLQALAATAGRGAAAGAVGGIEVQEQHETSSSSPNESGDESTSTSESPSPSSPAAQVVDSMARLEMAQRPLPAELPRILHRARGTEGTPLNLAVNYIRVKTNQGMGVFEYHVSFEPNLESRQMRYKVLHQPECNAIIGNIMQFTGMNLYLPRMLENDLIVIETANPANGSVIIVTLKFIKVPPFQELIPFYNTLFRKIMQTLKLVQINRHYFNPESRINVDQHRLEIWSGFVSAIHDLDDGLLLNLEASHRVLRTSTAIEMLKEIYNNADTRPRFKELALQRMVGCVVITRYNNKPYRIDDIEFNENPLSTFTYADGRTISYVEYMKEQWNQNIRDMRQPLLVHRAKPYRGQAQERIIKLVPELCSMTGLTDDIRSDVRAMKDIAQHTRVAPPIRQQKLVEFVQTINSNPEASRILSDWGLQLEGQPVRTQGRTFAVETISFGRGATATSQKASWDREATNSVLYRPIQVENWLLISTKRDSPRADGFVKCIQGASQKMGFTFKNPRRIEIDRDGPMDYANAIKNAFSAGDQVVVIITPGSSQKEDRYNAIKRLCCSDIAVPSQVIRANTLNDQNPVKFRSVCQKVAVQISCKIGAEPWAVNIPFKNCMIIGIDVYHDPSQRGKSVVAIVSSLNPVVTRWYTRVCFQNSNEEIVSSLEQSIVQCLKKFWDINQMLPQRIFIYRDGVSDGQLNNVREYEIVQIENAIMDYAKAFENYKPTLTTVVVQKRINAKMLMHRGELTNPPPGSVLDHTITRNNYYDFYLISQFVNQGTVTPTHYIVVHDNNGMTPDRMQKLSYKLTHLYYNWFGTIRTPAPCQYAHKAAYLCGQNIRRTVVESLSDKLYYL